MQVSSEYSWVMTPMEAELSRTLLTFMTVRLDGRRRPFRARLRLCKDLLSIFLLQRLPRRLRMSCRKEPLVRVSLRVFSSSGDRVGDSEYLYRHGALVTRCYRKT